MSLKKLQVTETYLPSLDEYEKYLKIPFESKWITNRGKLVLDLEVKLKNFLNVENIILMNNGTIPLQIALRNYGLNGEIITTPFSYIATLSSILWENCIPVFVDIEFNSLTIDVSKIEEAISPRTTCILGTHVFGNPCDVTALDLLAKKHNLKVIYDGAHCFGVQYNGRGLLSYGDASTCSFHSTKLFHTGEGGAVMFSNSKEYNNFFLKHNFGHITPTEFGDIGINGKMSELSAAMGLAVFDNIEFIFQSRKMVCDLYDKELKFEKFSKFVIRENTEWNYSYYPIICKSEKVVTDLIQKLNRNNIFPRRYFYPSLNTLSFVCKKIMPISEDVSRRILCLPLSANMLANDVRRVVKILNE